LPRLYEDLSKPYQRMKSQVIGMPSLVERLLVAFERNYASNQ
jgi:hypothetical protein